MERIMVTETPIQQANREVLSGLGYSAQAQTWWSRLQAQIHASGAGTLPPSQVMANLAKHYVNEEKSSEPRVTAESQPDYMLAMAIFERSVAIDHAHKAGQQPPAFPTDKAATINHINAVYDHPNDWKKLDVAPVAPPPATTTPPVTTPPTTAKPPTATTAPSPTKPPVRTVHHDYTPIDKSLQFDLETLGLPTRKNHPFDATKGVDDMDGKNGAVTSASIAKFVKDNGLADFNKDAQDKLHQLAEAKRTAQAAASQAVSTQTTPVTGGKDAGTAPPPVQATPAQALPPTAPGQTVA